MNEILKAMRERRSIRRFKPELPPESDVRQIVEAGLYAASGRNQQAVIFYRCNRHSFPNA